MKRIILSGGGTGGHIYPAITIAKEISRIEEAEILFVGTPNGMESKIIPKEGYKFASIHAYGLKRSFTVKNIANLAVTAKSVFRAKKILKEFNPDVVIGTGGYVCGPILMAAALQGIPTLIQEQNVIPGITNKILSRFVDRIALGYKEAAHRFLMQANASIQEIRSAGIFLLITELMQEKSWGFQRTHLWFS